VLCLGPAALPLAERRPAGPGRGRQVPARPRADVNQNNLWTSNTALFEAAQGGHFDIVKMLLEERADVNARNLAGETALMAAAGEGTPTSSSSCWRKGPSS